ncbi:hypothetical protein RJ640_028462 [Escallonia rubra]|uniref:RNase H type-1 domain-containing protein n=1 Tax=Escallonia rubra TaxID=112253 RepID=A0AA88UJ31_9ASTE|nr:hypothetical protein RJ640_028462 [Escallonia rubra]
MGRITKTSRQEELSIRNRLEDMLDMEESLWKQYSSSEWLRDGDHNTRFFHAKASARKNRNLILNIKNTEDDEVFPTKVPGPDVFKEVYAIGLGAAIRDSRGSFIAGLPKRVDNLTCPLMAEALATLDGIKLAQPMDCQRLCIEGDAADIIFALKSTEDNFSKIGLIVDEAKKLVSSFQAVQIA